ncbi:MAG: GGGtGRT protein [Coprococcus sp.]
MTKDAGLDVYNQVKEFSQFVLRMLAGHTVGAAIAIKKGWQRQQTQQRALSARVFRHSVYQVLLQIIVRLVLDMVTSKMLLEEETECFCFLAGHESFWQQ